LIAFVGPEATGKSTLVQETACWLGKVFDVSTAHLGKPPSTWLTFLPNLALPLLRKAAPQHRMSRVESDPRVQDVGRVSLLYALRSVLLAWDRRVLAVKVRRRATQGGIVICDRYPSIMVSAMDSARLRIPADAGGWGKLLGYLARLENHIYRQIPPPDVVIRLTVPVEVAIERNKERQKKGKEADAYVLRRHTTGVVPVFPTARTIELDSHQPRSQTISSVRQIVWDML
jgi:thymidylate kinase